MHSRNWLHDRKQHAFRKHLQNGALPRSSFQSSNHFANALQKYINGEIQKFIFPPILFCLNTFVLFNPRFTYNDCKSQQSLEDSSFVKNYRDSGVKRNYDFPSSFLSFLSSSSFLAEMIQRFVAEGRDRAANITNATFPSVFKILRGTINLADHALAELLGSLEQSRIKEANLRPVGRNLSISRELTGKTSLGLSSVWEPVKNNQFSVERTVATQSLSPFIFMTIDSI